MANQKLTALQETNRQPDNTSQSTPGPKKKPGQSDESVNEGEETIVNSEEQSTVLNEVDSDTSQSEDSANKEKGFSEGTRDDSLTEPGQEDSDDQLEFPDEEGK